MSAEVQAERAPRAAAAEAPVGHGHGGAAAFGLQTFASLRHTNFRYVWFGNMFMGAGQWIQQVTLGWLLYDLTGSAVLLGALNGVRAVPFLFVGPLAGVLADRVDRRKLVITCQALLSVSAVGMGWLVASGAVQPWHLFVFAITSGVVWSINQTARQTLVANVVPRRDLMNAITLNSMGFNMMKVLGPALGGFLIASFGAGGNFFVQAAAYGVVMSSLWFLQLNQGQRTAHRASVAANLREGLAYVKDNPLLLAIISAALIPSVLAIPVYQSLMPVFQKDILGVGPDALGLLLAAPGVGAITTSLFLATLAARIHRKGLLLIGAVGLLGTGLILFSQAPSLPVALVILAVMGGSQMTFASTTQSLLQILVPDELRGRVMSIYMLDHGLSPLGALLSGVLTSLIGAPTTVAIMGSLVLGLAVFMAVRVPRIREIEV